MMINYFAGTAVVPNLVKSQVTCNIKYLNIVE